MDSSHNYEQQIPITDNSPNYGQQSQLWTAVTIMNNKSQLRSTVPIMDSSHNYEQQIPITDNSPNYGQQSQF